MFLPLKYSSASDMFECFSSVSSFLFCVVLSFSAGKPNADETSKYVFNIDISYYIQQWVISCLTNFKKVVEVACTSGPILE